MLSQRPPSASWNQIKASSSIWYDANNIFWLTEVLYKWKYWLALYTQLDGFSPLNLGNSNLTALGIIAESCCGFVTIGDEVLGGDDWGLCYQPLPAFVIPYTVSDRACNKLVTTSNFWWTIRNSWSCCSIADDRALTFSFKKEEDRVSAIEAEWLWYQFDKTLVTREEMNWIE